MGLSDFRDIPACMAHAMHYDISGPILIPPMKSPLSNPIRIPLTGALLLLAGFPLQILRATTLLNDTISYESTSAFHSSSWLFDSSAGGQPLVPIEVVSGSLSKAGLAPSTGNKLSLSGNFQAAAIDLAESSSAYMSALVNFDQPGKINTDGSLMFYLGRRNVGAGTGLWVRQNGSNVDFGISKSGDTVTWSTGPSYGYGETLFVVLGYNSIAGNDNDIAQAWIYNQAQIDSTWGTANPSTPNISTSFGGGDLAINQLAINWNYSAINQPNYFLDEIRVGTTFADVTVVPEPSTYALFGLGALVMGIAYRRKAKTA
jgi:hypothetical protein